MSSYRLQDADNVARNSHRVGQSGTRGYERNRHDWWIDWSCDRLFEVSGRRTLDVSAAVSVVIVVVNEWMDQSAILAKAKMKSEELEGCCVVIHH